MVVFELRFALIRRSACEAVLGVSWYDCFQLKGWERGKEWGTGWHLCVFPRHLAVSVSMER